MTAHKTWWGSARRWLSLRGEGPAGRERRRVRLRLEQVEDRLVPAGTLPWPVAAIGGKHLLVQTYGQWEEAGGIHLHSGIDIVVPAVVAPAVQNAPVTAIEGGSVFSAQNNGNSSDWVSVTTGTHGWNYYHSTPLAAFVPTVAVPNPAVAAAPLPQISTVAAQPFANQPDHLHLDYTTNAVDPATAAVGANLLRVIGNPVDYLTDTGDTINPVVDADIHFMLASDQQRNGALNPAAVVFPNLQSETLLRDTKYFGKDAQNRVVVGAQAQATDVNGGTAAGSPNISIIANITDQMVANGYKIGVNSVWFKITGQTFGATTGDVNSFWFHGAFLGAAQNMSSFYSHTMARVIYMYDQNSESHTRQAYWYVVTNNDSDDTVEATDRNRYWMSNTSTGHAWNDNVGANAAARNANAAFPDDFYTVKVGAYDNTGNNYGETPVNIVLHNFVRNVNLDHFVYWSNEEVMVTGGANYRANQQVRLYVMTTEPTEGTPLVGLKATVTTNANGELPLQTLGKLQPGTYWVVADYIGDGVFHDRLDVKTDILVVKSFVSVDVTSSVNPSVRGQNVTFTAWISGTPLNGVPVPTGTANYVIDGGAPIQVNLDNFGRAIYSTNTLTVGVHTITVNYNGDVNYWAGSGSLAFGQWVLPKLTDLGLASSVNPSQAGQNVTFTATVTVQAPGEGTPTGSVTFYDNGSLLGTTALNGAGIATISQTFLTQGFHFITADYSGDPDSAPSSNSLEQIVNPAPSVTTLVSSLNPSYYTQTVTFTATVAAGGSPPPGVTPTGSVSFYDNGMYIGSASLVSGIATLATATLWEGSHSITANYDGDATFASSVSLPLSQTVLPNNTTTTLVAAPATVYYTQSVTLTATVAPSGTPIAGPPTGSVSFYDNGMYIGSATLVDGVATLSVPGLWVGTHTITASYDGDSTFWWSTSSPVDVNVLPNLTSTSLSASAGTIEYGGSVTLTATVVPNGTPIPGPITGWVSFYANGMYLGSAELVNGTAALTVSLLMSGSNEITASFDGNDIFWWSTSNPVTVNVESPP